MHYINVFCVVYECIDILLSALNVCRRLFIAMCLISQSVAVKLGPFSSDRQHLSYDVCLEVRGEIIRTVL